MGASQSTDHDSTTSSGIKTSYYELLGLQRQATEDEIKKAYRRKALELHPDRNYGNEETATKVFAEVQAAYEVLSDPQERAWYDSHETAILRGDDDVSGEDGVPTYENVRATTADDLARMVRKFNSNVDFSDAPSGFYGFLREAFEGLAKEESIAANWDGIEAPDYPSFGHKDDTYDDVVKRFYAAWSSFSTVKNFAWKDKYRLSEAPDRWYRRRMEQENKKFRQDGVREFNDAVRSLVAFVRKRDPRYVPSMQTEEERQKTLRDAAAAQAARARAANEAKLNQEVPEWTKIRDPEELEESSEEEIEVHIFECVACNKEFKSERQWEAHEKSKKHQKALYALQKKMRKENANFDLDNHAGSGVATPVADDDDDDDENELPEVIAISNQDITQDEKETFGVSEIDVPEQGGDSDVDQTREGESHEFNELHKHDEQSTTESEEDDEYGSAEQVQARLRNTTLAETPQNADSADDDQDKSDPATAKPKMGKAAQKRAKRAAAAAASQESESTHACATCKASFPSKTQLHQHIKDHKHAALKNVVTASSGKSKKKGKR